MIDRKQVRSLALVGPIAGERRMTHTAGFPLDSAKLLPPPDVVLVVSDADPADPRAMLFRYTAHGEFGGDTLHATAGEGRGQAADEYGDALGEWVDVPVEVPDAHAYAIRYAAERLNSRGDW